MRSTGMCHQAELLCPRFLPDTFRIVGYARSALTTQQLQERLLGFLKGDKSTIEKFLQLVRCICPGRPCCCRRNTCCLYLLWLPSADERHCGTLQLCAWPI